MVYAYKLGWTSGNNQEQFNQYYPDTMKDQADLYEAGYNAGLAARCKMNATFEQQEY